MVHSRKPVYDALCAADLRLLWLCCVFAELADAVHMCTRLRVAEMQLVGQEWVLVIVRAWAGISSYGNCVLPAAGLTESDRTGHLLSLFPLTTHV